MPTWQKYLLLIPLIVFVGIGLFLLTISHFTMDELMIFGVAVITYYGSIIIFSVEKKYLSTTAKAILSFAAISLFVVSVLRIVLAISLPSLLPGTTIDYSIFKIWWFFLELDGGLLLFGIFYCFFHGHKLSWIIKRKNIKISLLIPLGIFLFLLGSVLLIKYPFLPRRVIQTQISGYEKEQRYTGDFFYDTYYVQFSNPEGLRYEIDKRLFERLPIDSNVQVTFIDPSFLSISQDVMLKIKILD